MPGKKLTIEDGEVREADSDDVDGREFYRCPHCDAVRGTAEGIETHIATKHSEAA